MFIHNPKNRDFRHISGSTDRKKTFREKRIHHCAKKSEKSNELILRKACDRQTDGRTDTG